VASDNWRPRATDLPLSIPPVSAVQQAEKLLLAKLTTGVGLEGAGRWATAAEVRTAAGGAESEDRSEGPASEASGTTEVAARAA